MSPAAPDRPRRRLRAALIALGLVAAGLAFAAGLAALTTRIATPEIGLRGLPTLGEVAPAPSPRDVVGEPRPAPTTTTTPTATTSPTTTSAPTTAPEVEDRPDAQDGSETEDDDSGRGRGRGRSDDDDDD